MSRGYISPFNAGNPNNCVDPYTPSFWFGKPGALTKLRMVDAGYGRELNDHYAVHDLLDGQSIDRSPYGCRSWSIDYEWLKPEEMTVLMEYATRQRGFGPYIFVDPQMKNLLTPNQASGTDALHTSEGFSVYTPGESLSSSNGYSVQGERSLLWQSTLPATNVQTQILDTFSRSVSGGWGTADTGQTWAISGGVAPEYTVTGGVGRINNNSVNTLRAARMTTAPNLLDVDLQVDITVPVAPLGAGITQWLFGRSTDVNNYYVGRLDISISSGLAQVVILERVAGVLATLTSPVTVGTHTAGATWRLRFQIMGTQLRVKAWLTSSSEPTTWSATINDTSLTTGTDVGVISRLETGNTNTLPVITTYDNFSANYPTGYPNGGRVTVDTPTRLTGWVGPNSQPFAFSGTVRSAGDNNLIVRPRMLFLDGSGALVGGVTGSAIPMVTGSSSSFCITGSSSAFTYMQIDFIITGATSGGLQIIATNAGVYFDQLQLSFDSSCVTWEYGQGQPLVSIKAGGESIPRILRTNVGFSIMEVT